MKEIFKEYFAPTEEEKRDIWENATIVFDTNILFNLYRYTAETRENLLAVMEAYRDKLWLPYQVGYEYFNKRRDIIDKMTQAHNALKAKLDTFKNPLTEFFNKEFAHHPLIKREDFFNAYDEAIKTVGAKLDEWMHEMPDYQENDTILNKLLELYEGKTGNDYSEDRLKEIYKECEQHYKESIPPGFKDWKDKEHEGKRHQSGDLIIWRQILDYAKTHDTDIIFVTEDQKVDWWHKDGDIIISPREELLLEFRTKTGKKLLMYRQNGFLNDANVEVKDTTKEEVKIISEEDKEAFTRAMLDSVMEELQLKVEPTAAYPSADIAKLLSNPIQSVIESQKRLQEQITPPWITTIADLVAAQAKEASVSELISKIAAGSLTSSIPNWPEILGKKK